VISIFNGRNLSADGATDDVYVKVSVAMREHLHEFNTGKNLNPLGVFLAIALHADAWGWCWPSRRLLKKETGVTTDNAMSSALAHLRAMRIGGARTLAMYRERDPETQQWGYTCYRIFPDAWGALEADPLEHAPAHLQHLTLYDLRAASSESDPVTDIPYVGSPQAANPHLETSEQKKIHREQKPTSKENQEKKDCAAHAARAPKPADRPADPVPELTEDQLAKASGLAALEHARQGDVPWSEPGAAYELPATTQDGRHPNLAGWPGILAKRRWSGDVRMEDVLALAGRFADATHADLTPPSAADPGAVKDWAAALERLLISASPGRPPADRNGGLASWLDLRRRRAAWILDWIFVRRSAGDHVYAGFTISRPGSILKIATNAEADLRHLQKAEGLENEHLPAIDPAKSGKSSGASDPVLRQVAAHADAIRNRSRHAAAPHVA
jgi:hypothetical protein